MPSRPSSALDADLKRSLPDKEVLTVEEVAELLRVNAKTVYALAQRGELRTFRVGRVMRCHRQEVARFISAGGSGTTPDSALGE